MIFKKRSFWLVISISAFLALGLNCYAQPLSSSELINSAKLYDGKAVVYEGEAIGEVMLRGDYAWVNIHDGKNALGVWLPRDLARDILAGSYKSKGDWLEVSGTFNRACLAHGGDPDIHAQAIRKLKAGRPVAERPNIGKRNLAFVLAGLLTILWILSLLKGK